MAVISFKVTDAEAREIRRRAKREHTTVSAYIRKKAMEDSDATSAEMVYETSPLTGAKIFGRNPGLPPLTTDYVKQAMADFP